MKLMKLDNETPMTNKRKVHTVQYNAHWSSIIPKLGLDQIVW